MKTFIAFIPIWEIEIRAGYKEEAQKIANERLNTVRLSDPSFGSIIIKEIDSK